MSETMTGFDRQSVSTPFDLRRGSRVAIKRTVLTWDQDQGRESVLNIASGQASEIVWHLLENLKQGTVAKLTKTLTGTGVAAITLQNTGTDGKYQFTIDDADTVNLALGIYYAELAVVSGGNRFKFAPYLVNLQAAGNLGE